MHPKKFNIYDNSTVQHLRRPYHTDLVGHTMFLCKEIEARDKGMIFKAFVVGKIRTVCSESTIDLRHDFRGCFGDGVDCTGYRLYNSVTFFKIVVALFSRRILCLDCEISIVIIMLENFNTINSENFASSIRKISP
jgi:hypothetical protein